MKIYNIKHLKFFKKCNFNWLNDQDIQKVVKTLKKPWRFVGGCVRDSLNGQTTKDIDIVTLALPEEILQNLDGFNTTTIGQKFGTIGVFIGKWNIEITTTRIDYKTFGRKAEVLFTKSFSEDSNRRDFSINALMLSKNNIYDYHHGIQALLQHKIIFIKNPEKRITEDFLRIIRYIRFCVKFNNFIKLIKYSLLFKKYLEKLKLLSIERVIDELLKMANYEHFQCGIEIMNELGINKTIFSTDLYTNLSKAITIEQKMVLTFKDYDNFIKLPLPKSIKNILSACKKDFDDILVNTAYVWHRTKSADLTSWFLWVQEIAQNTDFSYIKQKLLEPINEQQKCTIAEGPLYGKYLFLQKYYHLCGQNFQQENLEDQYTKIFSHKLMQYK